MPCFAKPVMSSAIIEGRLRSFSVAKITDRNALERKLRDDLELVPLLLQEPLSGHGVGLNFAAHEGKVLGVSVTERLHEPTRRGSTYGVRYP